MSSSNTATDTIQFNTFHIKQMKINEEILANMINFTKLKCSQYYYDDYNYCNAIKLI